MVWDVYVLCAFVGRGKSDFFYLLGSWARRDEMSLSGVAGEYVALVYKENEDVELGPPFILVEIVGGHRDWN